MTQEGRVGGWEGQHDRQGKVNTLHLKHCSCIKSHGEGASGSSARGV